MCVQDLGTVKQCLYLSWRPWCCFRNAGTTTPEPPGGITADVSPAGGTGNTQPSSAENTNQPPGGEDKNQPAGIINTNQTYVETTTAKKMQINEFEFVMPNITEEDLPETLEEILVDYPILLHCFAVYDEYQKVFGFSSILTPRPHRARHASRRRKKWLSLPTFVQCCSCCTVCEHPNWQQWFPLVALRHASNSALRALCGRGVTGADPGF